MSHTGNAERILDRMRVLRESGTRVAEHLPADIKRAKDWREYVRAVPLPSVAVAASLGFLAVMSSRIGSKPAERQDRPRGYGHAYGFAPQGPASQAAQREERAEKRSVLKTAFRAAGGWAAAYAVSQLTQFAQHYAAHQLQSFKQGFGNDVHHRQAQRYPQTDTPYSNGRRG